MKLETHEGVVTHAASADDVAATVHGLVDQGEAYVVLDDGRDESYVQAAGTVGEDFIVERRDGCAGEHYRTDRRLSANELISLLLAYLSGAEDWSWAVTWHRVRVDPDRPVA